MNLASAVASGMVSNMYALREALAMVAEEVSTGGKESPPHCSQQGSQHAQGSCCPTSLLPPWSTAPVSHSGPSQKLPHTLCTLRSGGPLRGPLSGPLRGEASLLSPLMSRSPNAPSLPPSPSLAPLCVCPCVWCPLRVWRACGSATRRMQRSSTRASKRYYALPPSRIRQALGPRRKAGTHRCLLFC